MPDPTEPVDLPLELLEALQQARPGVPLDRLVEEAVRAQLACPHETLSCSTCGNTEPRARWFDRELVRRKWRARTLSDFYEQVHAAIAGVVNHPLDNSAAAAARAVHDVARAEKLPAARRLVPAPAKSRTELVDEALGRFYSDLVWELLWHLNRPGATASGFGSIMKRVAVAHGVSKADRLALPRPPRQARRGDGGARTTETLRQEEEIYEMVMRQHQAELGKDAIERPDERPTFCPRPEDHLEAALARIARAESDGKGTMATVAALAEEGYQPPAGDGRWSSDVLAALRDQARAVVGRPSSSALDAEGLPMLRYAEVIEAIMGEHGIELWCELARALHSRPGWRLRFEESGLPFWVHDRKRLWASIEGGHHPRFVAWHAGRHVDDVAWWDFATVEELLEELALHEVSRHRVVTRTGGLGRWWAPLSAAPTPAET